MKVNTIKTEGTIINGFLVTQPNGSTNFCMSNREISIMFNTEYEDGGGRFKITMVYDKLKDRVYQAEKSTRKHEALVMEMSYNLLIENYLWDYKQQCPAIESYAWDIKDYIEECIKLGIAY